MSRPQLYLPWLWCAWILVSGLLPEPANAALEFNRQAISQGQIWRLFTAQWIHFGFHHSLLNAACLAMVEFKLLASLRLNTWFLGQAFIQLGVGLGLWFYAHEVEIYRGFSGAFCGLLAWGLLLHLDKHNRALGVIYAGLLVKIIIEQQPNYDHNYLRGVIGVAVATDAHLCGLVSGTLLAVAQRSFTLINNTQRPSTP